MDRKSSQDRKGQRLGALIEYKDVLPGCESVLSYLLQVNIHVPHVRCTFHSHVVLVDLQFNLTAQEGVSKSIF